MGGWMADLARFLTDVGIMPVVVEETLAKLHEAGATEVQLRTTVLSSLPLPSPPPPLSLSLPLSVSLPIEYISHSIYMIIYIRCCLIRPLCGWRDSALL